MADSGFTLNKEKLAQLQARSAAVRTGGKGSVRRKKKSDHKPGATDDKRLQGILKGLRMGPIDGIDEANLFKDNGMVIHFNQPKVQAANGANTFVISGNAENKALKDLLPGILNQLGPDNLEALKQLAGGAGAFAGMGARAAGGDDDDGPPALVDTDGPPDLVDAANDDDGPPELVDFEAASKK